MARALLAALLTLSAAALAQNPTPPAGADKPAAAPAPAAPANGSPAIEDVRREIDAKVESAKKEMREEMRAQLATQSLAQGWQEEYVEEKRKLELFVADGYFRVRPDLFYKFDLGRGLDPSGYTLFPTSPVQNEHTLAGANMRLRLEPTLNISEEVRIRMQIDALDDVVFGSTPAYAFSRSQFNNYSILMQNGQAAPSSGVNALLNSVAVKRVYGEVSTPVGILRFGRMGSHWGLGMLHNDGNCLDCDNGDTADRIQFVSTPVPGWYITPMIDFDSEGPVSRDNASGQPFDLSNQDDTHSYIIAVARRDTDQQIKAKLENNLPVFNFGGRFTYRTQKYEAVDFFSQGFQTGDVANYGYVRRDGSLYMGDLWAQYQRRDFRIEAEVAGIYGQVGNHALSSTDATNRPGTTEPLYMHQLGGVLQGEYRLLDNKLKLMAEVGFASGDQAPGLGNRPLRATALRGTTNATQTGDIDGPQYSCNPLGGCDDNTIDNFQFNRDYRIDMILWREILGPITDAIYVKPSADYKIAEGFHVFASIIYSRTIFKESSPSGNSNDLGVELNGGVRYETEDGFIGGVAYGILFPLSGLNNNSGTAAASANLDTAQTVRGYLGIKF